MSDAVRKRSPAWKIVGIIAGVIVLSIVALLLWAGAAAGRKITRIQDKSRARLAAVRGADPGRPVLRGAAVPGNAWDDYALAQAEVKKFPDARRLGEIVDRSPKADPEIGKKALAAHGAALDHLRRGAARSGSRYPYEWERGSAMAIPGLLDSTQTASLAVLRVRALAAEGLRREAAGVLLDLCQYGRDLGSDGVVISYMMGMAILGIALNETRDQLLAGTLDRAALEDLGRGLETLDGTFPSYGEALINESLLFAGLMDDSTTGGWGPQQLVHADAIERMSEATAAAAKAESLPWSEAREELRRIESEALDSWNPIARMTVPSLGNSSWISRARRAQLRALRMAVHAAVDGKPLDLDDPFGAKMRTEEKGGKLRIWSIGQDGVDDGGAGEWKTHPPSKDIVLEVKR